MKYSQLINKLQNLTMTKANIKEIADIIEKPVRTLYTRGQRDSSFTLGEIKKIEKYYGIKLSGNERTVPFNSLKRRYEDGIEKKHSGCAERILNIQKANSLSNIQMSVLLDISELEFSEIIKGKLLPDLKLLDSFKKNFEVSIDWLLYGN